MEKYKNITDKKGWFYLAVSCIAVSFLSMFLPIFINNGNSYNILDLINQNSEFEKNVIQAYEGPVIWNLTSGLVATLAFLGALSLICAIVGLVTLRAQRPNTMNFALTIAGLVGILIPSLTAIICVTGFKQYYPGGLSLGIAPVISPLAIIISILAVIRRKNKVAEELRKEVEDKGLIWKAGDLE